MSGQFDLTGHQVRDPDIVSVGWTRLLFQDQDAINNWVSIAPTSNYAVLDVMGV